MAFFDYDRNGKIDYGQKIGKTMPENIIYIIK